MYYRYTQKWVDLFNEQPQMVAIETGHYIKGMHNLLNAHFDLRNYVRFDETLKAFEKFSHSKVGEQSNNNLVQTFVYLNTAKINQHFMKGSFEQGLKLVPYLEEKLEEYSLFLDQHRILVFYYKIGSLYFGSGDYKRSIDYVQKIINWKVDLRNDLQCYARLMHLLAHYELGNYELMEPLTKSVYRFMAKMENLTIIEEEMFRFLRNNFRLSPRQMRPEFEKLLAKIKKFEKSRFETRAFAYLDIISWLESKVYDQPMKDVIHEKYLRSPHRIK
jgi:tetratricopeptide (TPR) repeat protein